MLKKTIFFNSGSIILLLFFFNQKRGVCRASGMNLLNFSKNGAFLET